MIKAAVAEYRRTTSLERFVLGFGVLLEAQVFMDAANQRGRDSGLIGKPL